MDIYRYLIPEIMIKVPREELKQSRINTEAQYCLPGLWSAKSLIGNLTGAESVG